MFRSLIFPFLILSFSLYAEDEVCEIPGTPFVEVQNLLKGINDNCQELARGTFRIQRTLAGRGQHLLERDSGGNYRATMNVQFKPKSGITTTPTQMQEAVNSCLRMMAPYLKGPEGNTILIRVLSPDETKLLPRGMRPEKMTIEIGENGSRSNNRMFSADDDCATYIHEMLHNLGLQDEYPETSEELKDKWNCRATTRKDSIMYYHTWALDSAVPKTILCDCSVPACEGLKAKADPELLRRIVLDNRWPLDSEFQRKYCTYNYTVVPTEAKDIEGLEIDSDTGDRFVFRYQTLDPFRGASYQRMLMTLNCSCADDECRQKKAEILSRISQPTPNQKSCPWGMKEDSREIAPGKYQAAFRDGKFRFSSTPERSTLLYPKQFRRAIAGTCEKNIEGYGMCSEFAYKGASAGKCQTPAECTNPDFYIGPTPQ